MLSDSDFLHAIYRDGTTAVEKYLFGRKLDSSHIRIPSSIHYTTSVDFKNSIHFIRVFKKSSGFTPHRYRSVNKIGKSGLPEGGSYA